MAAPGGTRYYYYDNTVKAAIYALKNNVWTYVSSRPVYVSGGPYGTGGTRTFNWSVDDTFQLGSGVQAVGISIESVDAGSGAVTSFSHVVWQAQGSTGGTRSATPNSEQSSITVRPN